MKKIEDLLEKNPIENVNLLRKYFEEIKPEIIEIVNGQLNKFREVYQMGKKWIIF